MTWFNGIRSEQLIYTKVYLFLLSSRSFCLSSFYDPQLRCRSMDVGNVFQRRSRDHGRADVCKMHGKGSKLAMPVVGDKRDKKGTFVVVSIKIIKIRNTINYPTICRYIDTRYFKFSQVTICVLIKYFAKLQWR